MYFIFFFLIWFIIYPFLIVTKAEESKSQKLYAV